MRSSGSYIVLAAIVSLVCLGTVAFSQNKSDSKPDRLSHPISQPGSGPDLVFEKYIWREIDTREKQNIAFRYPLSYETDDLRFIDMLLSAIKSGRMNAYSALDDQFRMPMDAKAIVQMLPPETYDSVGRRVTIPKGLDPSTVTRYRVKERWAYDRNLGRVVVHIVGIAPMVQVRDSMSNKLRGVAALFWLNYAECRETLAMYEVYDSGNCGSRVTWEDYFEGRHFSSRIIKSSNPFDEYVLNMPDEAMTISMCRTYREMKMDYEEGYGTWDY